MKYCDTANTIAIPMNDTSPKFEEILVGMKSATIAISESTIRVIITTIMRTKRFLLSNLEKIESVVGGFICRISDLRLKLTDKSL